jgi:hypothetical protein
MNKLNRTFLRHVLSPCVFAILIIFGSCAPARYVKPLAKGQTVATASFGGPLIHLSKITFPMPLTSVAVGHGFKDDLTGFAGLHITSLAFGVFQTDLGIVKGLVTQKGWRPGVSVSPVVNLMFDKWQQKFSFFPQLDAHAYWNYKKKPHYAYVGMSNWFDLHTTRAEGEPQKTHWVPVLELGNTLVRRKWDYTLEIKYLAPNYSRKRLVVDYQGLGQNGSFGVYIGVTRKF